MTAFILWTLCGSAIIGLGIYDFLSKKAVAFGFWANTAMFPVSDARAYNRAVGKLFMIFGIVFILLGIPFLFSGQNSPLALLPILGAMAETIAAMTVYTVVIEKKYRKNN